MALPSNEARINLALEALKNDYTLSLRAVAKIYSVSPATLMRRRNGRPTQRDILANLRKLTDLEECMIVQYITEIWSTTYYANATRPLLVNAGLTTSLNASYSSGRVIYIDTTTRGPSTRIYRLLASSLLLYETLRLSMAL